MGKTKKVMAGITTTALLFGLSGCGGTAQEQTSNEDSNGSSQPPSVSYSDSTPDDSSTTYVEDENQPRPDDPNCSQWNWDDDDGVWECEDSGSSYYGHYFHGGRYYKSKPELFKSTDYMNYKKSSAFKGKGATVNSGGGTNASGTTGSGGSTVKGSTGFGNGSASIGG